MPTPPLQPNPDQDHGHRRHRVDPRSRRRTVAKAAGGAPFRLGQPRTVPITEAQQRQAVTALAAMIASWWQTHHQPPEREGTSTR